MKVALLALLVAGKGDFRHALLQEIADGSVGDLTHLVVLLHDFPAGVADAAIASLDQGIACAVRGADVAVDSSPPFVAVAPLFLAHRSVWASGQGSADWSKRDRLDLEASRQRAKGGSYVAPGNYRRRNLRGNRTSHCTRCRARTGRTSRWGGCS